MQPKQLGPYRIVSTLGKGGMGTVYEGVGEDESDRVAIKVLSPQLATAEGFRERFEAEIESLKKLNHENIVQLYGYGQDDGFLFYSMELVDGPSLEEEISARRRFNWREVTQIGIMICKALKHAHDRGVIHRDLKPANLLLAPDETVKLTDFGIARLFGGMQLTQAGGLLGTAEFMSPEQAEGAGVTDRCDQYSLGGLLYALLAGRPPFRARNMPEMLQLQRYAHPEPVSRYASDTPKELERIVMKLLEKDPQDRYANTAIVARELSQMLRSLTQPIDHGFEVPTEEKPAPEGPPISQAETLAVTSSPEDDNGQEKIENDKSDSPQTALFVKTTGGSPIGSDEREDNQLTPADSAVSRFRTSNDSGVEATAVGGGSKTPLPRGSRFVTLEEESRQEEQQSQQETRKALAPVLGLAVVLLGLVGLIVWFIQPPSADQLYQSIGAAAESDDPRSLLGVEGKIREFLERYPDDSRAAQTQGYLEEIEITRLERRLRARGRSWESENFLLIESLVLEAQRIAEWDTEAASAKLQSIIELYGEVDQKTKSEPDPRGKIARTRRCLELARRQLDRLQDRAEKNAQLRSRQLDLQLQHAEALLKSKPERAKEMLRAIVKLFSEKAWAAGQVSRAKKLLEQHDVSPKP